MKKIFFTFIAIFLILFFGYNLASVAYSTSTTPFTFTKNLRLGMADPEVFALQVYLNDNSFPLAPAGAGSPGKETSFFGNLTKIALIKFQEKNRAEILDPLGLKQGTGNFFGSTRAFVNASLLKSGSNTDNSADISDIIKFLTALNTSTSSISTGGIMSTSPTTTPLIKTVSRHHHSSIVATTTPTEEATTSVYVLSYLSGANGTLTGSTTQSVVSGENGTEVTATPDAGYYFTSWSDGVLTASRTDTDISENISVTANFAINTFTLTSSAGSNGTISPNGATSKNYGSSQTYTITPAENYHVNDVLVDSVSVGAVANYTFTNVITTHTISASFAINTFILSYSTSTGGTLTGSTTQIVNYNGSGSLVTAVPDSGYHFTTWSDAVLTAGRTDSNITANKTVTASFAANSVVTVTSVATSSAYNIASVILTSINGTGFLEGATVKLTKAGQADINCTAVTVASSTLISNASCHIVLATAGTWSVVVTNTDTGTGTLTNGFTVREYALRDVGPSGGLIFYINANYVADGWRYLEAAPSDQSSGRTWSSITNASSGATGTTTGNGPANTALIVTQSANSAGGACDSLVVGSYTDWFMPSQDELNQMYLNLHAYAVGGFNTVGTSYWSSSEINATSSRRQSFSTGLQSTSLKTVNSYQVRAARKIIVDTSFILSYSAGAHGTLTGSTTQAVNFGTNGTAVTAIPDVGYHFTSWSDGVLTAERTDLNIAGDISVSASFSVNVDASYTLTYTAEANGTIVGTTPQTVQYGNNGSTVTASSSAGYHFVSWSDGVLTAERTDSNVQGNITVSASFAINVYTLSYVAGAHGSLTGSTTQAVNFGTNGTAVTATPDAGYHFTTWSDGVLTAERTDLNIVGDISVTASFAINTYILNYSAGANGSLTGSTTQTVNYGSSGTAVVAAPESSGYHFTAWSDGVLTASRTDTNVTANKTVSASFAPNSIVTVTSVATTSAYNIASVYLTSIVGTGFLDGATVKLTKTGQPDIACTSVVVDSSTLISNAYCHIVLATAGLWNVVVTNTDTGAGSLDNSFTVREYALRDVGPSGGLIFYINANYVADGWRYLEAAPSDQSTGRTWSNVSSLVGTTGTAAGTGPANTTAINAQSTNSAAGICDSLTVGSYTDWFLPSQDELSLMYTNLHLSGVGGFTASGYWSSSEVDATNAIRRTFSGVPNNPESKGKTTSYRVRAIRRFSVDPTYTVTYNGNENTGGTVPVDGTAYEFASAVIVEGVGSLVRNQDAFLGWNTTADGSGTRYLAGSTLTMGSSNVTLYAEWQSFTIAFLPDTQSYVKDKREVMTTQLDWLVANKTLKNIKFVSHEGDVVQNWENANTAEWEFVQAEMNKLTTASIPYSANPGNHDYAYMTRGNTSLNTYFPLSSFQSMATFSGSYDTNSDNTYHIIDMAGHSLLILSLEFGPRDAVMTWANNVLSTHPTIPAIIVTHAYMSPTNELLSSSGDKAPSNGYGLNPDVNDGTDMWTELVYPNNNVRFVICGHVGTATDGSGFIDSTHADGSHVYQILSNYQYYTNFPGYLLLLNFSSATVTLRTYSPYLSAFKTDPESQNDFSWSFE